MKFVYYFQSITSNENEFLYSNLFNVKLLKNNNNK